MRFRSDPVLQAILRKMREPGDDRVEFQLTAEEWQALLHTDIANGASLIGTDLWHQAGYAWTIASPAQWYRSVYSAAHHKATLYMVAAKDHLLNVEPRDRCHVRDALLAFPNMNMTGRLPGIALLHLDMRVRLTLTICPKVAPVASTGVIQHIELQAADRIRLAQQAPGPRVLLEHLPTVLVKLDDCEEELGFGPGVLAITPKLNNETFSLDVTIPEIGAAQGTKKTITAKAQREGVPLVIANASTLYTLQGTTAEPGLIWHWRFPSRLSREMKWLTVYMALSRVRSLEELRSIGLCDSKISKDVKELINGGPPTGMLTRFLDIFQEKANATDEAADEAMRELGW
jgi:hypothetical protein